MRTNTNNILESNEYNRAEYLKWKKKNVTIRGISEVGSDNGGGAMLGDGLYTAYLSNKELAKKYGKVYFLVNARPKNPKKFNTLNEWEIWFGNTLVVNVLKEHGIYDDYPDERSFFDITTIKDEMIKLGYDGVDIKGREIVNYEPENVIYFSNEDQLENYYDHMFRNIKY
jgi:hypothetical protein